MSASTILTPSCRFCYSYQRPGFIQPCCPPPPPSITTLQSISAVTNNSANTTSQTLLVGTKQTLQRDLYQASVMSTVQANQQNQNAILSTIQGQRLLLQQQRYQPYQPYYPPVMPSSVIELQMRTVNVGVPEVPAAMSNCKGQQFITK